jgi:hypothetical protein
MFGVRPVPQSVNRDAPTFFELMRGLSVAQNRIRAFLLHQSDPKIIVDNLPGNEIIFSHVPARIIRKDF